MQYYCTISFMQQNDKTERTKFGDVTGHAEYVEITHHCKIAAIMISKCKII